MREIKIKALNTSIYIDKFNNTIGDGKIRVYDTNKNYLAYYEDITFENEQEYEEEIKYLENAKTIKELLSMFCLYENKDFEFVQDFEMGDCVNIIGDYKLLFF